MKKILLTIILSFFLIGSSYAYDMDAYGRPTNNTANRAYNNPGTTTWDNYGRSYNRTGNQVNSSDGKIYKPYGSSGGTFNTNSQRNCTPNFSTGGCL